jgi:hypothetical protein
VSLSHHATPKASPSPGHRRRLDDTRRWTRRDRVIIMRCDCYRALWPTAMHSMVLARTVLDRWFFPAHL